VIYVPGNHDEAARQYCSLTFGGVQVLDEVIHERADGSKLLVIHGDQFDGIVRYARWLAITGDWAYAAALKLNTVFNWGRRKLGLPYWSLSAYLKQRVKNAVQFINDFERAVAAARIKVNEINSFIHWKGIFILSYDRVMTVLCQQARWLPFCSRVKEPLFKTKRAQRCASRLIALRF
jgi:UDP-2,3-diacylglucosamine pyrophosphatase LpxH